MSTWHKVGSNGECRGKLVLPDEFELWIRRLEAERDKAIEERDMKADALSEYAWFEDALITAMGYDPDNCALSTSDMAEICEIVRISRIPKDIDTIYRNLQFMHAQEDAEKYKAERDDARRWARHYKRLYEATQKAAPFVTDEVHITRQSKRSKGGSKNGTV